MYRTCPDCGSNLDPGEICECRKEEDLLPVPVFACTRQPIIPENLSSLSAYVETFLSQLQSLPQEDNSLRAVKAFRAQLRNRFEALEDQRKAAKQAVLEPYRQAEAVYKARISDPFTQADAALKDWIDTYQNGLKSACEKRLRDYFAELTAAKGVPWLPFERSGVTVDMSLAQQKEPRIALDALYAFAERTTADVRAISKMENAPQLMQAYMQTLSLPEALDALASQNAALAFAQSHVHQLQQIAENVDASRSALLAAAPQLQEPLFTLTFTVTATKPDLKRLKDFLSAGNYTIKEDP